MILFFSTCDGPKRTDSIVEREGEEFLDGRDLVEVVVMIVLMMVVVVMMIVLTMVIVVVMMK